MSEKTLLKRGNSYLEYFQKLDKSLVLNKTMYQKLWDIHPENFGIINIFGKDINTPRWFQNYGHSYNFSNKNHESIPIPEILQPYIDFVNSRESDFNYNGVLVNWYQDGKHYIGKHKDDETELIKTSPIYCFSFGSKRTFIVENNEEKYKYELLNNSLIIMGGDCQKYYKHSIPKRLRVKDSRISITIRAFK